MPWFLEITQEESYESIKHKDRIVAQPRPVYNRRLVAKLVLWLALLTSITINVVSALSRLDLLFPERIAPIALLTTCHSIYFGIITLAFLGFWESSPEEIPRTKIQ